MALFNLHKTATSDMKPTLITNEYGGVTLIPPSRPEPAYVAPERMTADEVVTLLGYYSVEQIDEAAAVGFPKAVSHVYTQNATGSRRMGVYSAEKVREWRARVKRLANL